MDFISIAHAGVITDAPSLSSAGMKILNFLLSVFGIIAIIMLVASGIIYFLSSGNKNMAELAKKSANFAVVGIIMAMGGMILIGFIGQFFKQ